MDDFERDEGDTVFRDMLFLALAGFVSVVILLLPHVNPPIVPTTDDQRPGDMAVEIRWPDGYSSDVDLWVKAPNSRPIGYSNKNGPVMNLLRDDLGTSNDTTPLNYEFVYSRGVHPGEYVVNLHLYRVNTSELPIPVTVVVSVRPEGGGVIHQIITRTVELRTQGQELTVTRFTLNEHGHIVQGSEHQVPRSLRGAANNHTPPFSGEYEE